MGVPIIPVAIGAAKLASKFHKPIKKAVQRVIKDLKPKLATKSGKQARRSKELMKTKKPRVQRQNIRQATPSGQIRTGDKGKSVAKTGKGEAITTRNPKGQIVTLTGKGGRFDKTARAAEKAVKKRDSRRAATQVIAAGTILGSAVVGSQKLLPKSKSYRVKEGDTLSEIARDKGTTLGKIAEANPEIKDLNKVKPGQKIQIPKPPVKNRKSVYQDMSKDKMKKISMSKRKQGGKVYKRKSGGQVISGTDFVASLYE